MIIQKVKNKEEALKCDELLTKLIETERKYDKNIKKEYIVENYFENIYKSKDSAVFIAKNEEMVVGYAFCKKISSEKGPEIHPVAMLDGLYVVEEFRKQKVATKLIEKCKKWAIKNGCKYFEVNVVCENNIALEVYKKNGFSEHIKKMRLEL